MPRPNNVFKRTTNRLLDALAAWREGDALPAEAELVRLLDASRTTIRQALRHATASGLVTEAAGTWRRGRPPEEGDYFDDAQISSRSEIIERVFMDQVLQGALQPGQRFSETDLARLGGASTAAVREFLINFSRFGLVEKRPRGGWTLRGFDRAYAAELAEIRMLLELAAMDRLAACGLSEEDRAWLDDIIARHERLRARMGADYMDFPGMDQEFHAWIVSKLSNRFAEVYFSAICIVFIYHYQWNRAEERRLNTVALEEHLAVLAELRRERFDAARAALVRHLTTSRTAMMRSLAPGPPQHAEVKAS